MFPRPTHSCASGERMTAKPPYCEFCSENQSDNAPLFSRRRLQEGNVGRVVTDRLSVHDFSFFEGGETADNFAKPTFGDAVDTTGS